MDRIALLFLAFCMLFTVAQAESLNEVRIHQVVIDENLAKTYFNIYDNNGKALPDIDKNSIMASVEDTKLSLLNLKRSAEGTSTVFLVDVSASISDEEFTNIRISLKEWVNKLSSQDAAAIISFGAKVDVVSGFTSDKQILEDAINTLEANQSHTALYEGIEKGVAVFSEGENPPTHPRKTMVLLSDGRDTADGDIQKAINSVNSINTSLYVAWHSSLKHTQREQGYDALRKITGLTNGFFFDCSTQRVEDIYRMVYEDISSCYYAEFNPVALKMDGSTKSLKLQVARDGILKEDTRPITLTQSDVPLMESEVLPQSTVTAAEAPNPAALVIPMPRLILIIGIIPLLILAAIAFLIIRHSFKSRKKKPIHVNNQAYDEMRRMQQRDKPVASGMQFKIIGLGSNKNTHEINIRDTIIMGRGRCDVRVDDSLVSSTHCALRIIDSRLMAEDLDSTNGTIVNGILIDRPCAVKNGDTIMLGNHEFRIEF